MRPTATHRCHEGASPIPATIACAHSVPYHDCSLYVFVLLFRGGVPPCFPRYVSSNVRIHGFFGVFWCPVLRGVVLRALLCPSKRFQGFAKPILWGLWVLPPGGPFGNVPFP